MLVLLVACGAPPKSDIPSLNPEQAAELLHFNHRADNWITYVKKHNPACGYRIDLPDQSNHPAEIDIPHAVWCGNAPSPKEFDASVVFTYDTDAKKWTISRFAS
jgi:hypothetical protein